MPKRERYLWVCTNERVEGHPKGSCARSGAREVLDELKRLTAERGLKKRVRVCGSTCLDLCHAGVSIAVEPDQVFYGRVQLRDVPEIVEALVHGKTVARLELAPDEFDEPAKER